MLRNQKHGIVTIPSGGAIDDADLYIARLLQTEAKRLDNTSLACYKPSEILQHKDYVIEVETEEGGGFVTEIHGRTFLVSMQTVSPAFRSALIAGIPPGIKTFQLKELPIRATMRYVSGKCQTYLQVIGASDESSKKVRVFETRLLVPIDLGKIRITYKREFSLERVRNALLLRM